jgi:Tfp pilus assembly protein FimV
MSDTSDTNLEMQAFDGDSKGDENLAVFTLKRQLAASNARLERLLAVGGKLRDESSFYHEDDGPLFHATMAWDDEVNSYKKNQE